MPANTSKAVAQPGHTQPPTHPQRSHKVELRPGRIINLFAVFSWMSIVVVMFLIYRSIQLGYPISDFWAGLSFIIAVLINLAIYRVNEHHALLIFQALVFLAVATLYVTGGATDTGRFWLLPYPFVSMFIRGYRKGRIWLAAMLAWVGLVQLAETAGLLELPYPEEINLLFLVLYVFMNAVAFLRGFQADRQFSQIYRETQREQSLEQEFKKFKMAADNAVEMIVMTDTNGIITYANRATETLSGFSADEVVGKKAGTKLLWGGLMPDDFYRRLWTTIIKDKRPFIDVVRNRRKNGEEYYSRVNISPVFGEDSQIAFYVAIYEDITREQAVEDAKTEFVSIASHQLQTPIAAIGWLTELLTSNVVGKLTARQREVVVKIEQSNQRMVDLVNALLNTSRIEVGTFMITPEQTDLAAVLRDVVAEAQIHPAHKVTITEEYDPKTPAIPADPMLLRTVLQNLITNALRYTPDGGRIAVRLKQDKNSVTIEVADTGIGIPANSREHIFKKFYRAPNAVKYLPEGIGLGMYITKSIVDVSGGTVTFSSAEGQGTTFQVRYPRTGMRSKSGSRHLALMGSS